jgi:hypothetical protein
MNVWRILLADEVELCRRSHAKPLNGLEKSYPGPRAVLTGFRVPRALRCPGRPLAVVLAKIQQRSNSFAKNRNYPVRVTEEAPVELDADVPLREEWFLVYQEANE